MTERNSAALSRRTLLKGTGALVVGFGIGPSVVLEAIAADGTTVASGKPALHPGQLDSWIAIRGDGRVTAFFGKMDMGQGVDVAIAQIVAEELDVPADRVDVVMGDTALTVNQGGASGSTGVKQGGVPLRNAAAEARRVLVDMAATNLKLPASDLQVADGVVSSQSEPGRKVSYAELIGDRYFNHPLEWNEKYGNSLVAKGHAKPKNPSDYKVVGTPQPRRDIPGKIYGTLDFVTDVKVPGMVHGRVIRPPKAGAVPVSVDESSVADIPGVVVVREKDFLGLVAENEWDAIRAAERLKVSWSDVEAPFPPMDKLYDRIRETPARKGEVEVNEGDAEAALASAAKVIEAEYEWPFQSHASMGPACAVVDARPDGATVWTGSQKPHYTRDGVAAILGLAPETVHGIWVPGPGSYGRNDAGDAAMEAAVLSKAVGRPVRVQGMRYEGHGWDPKSPASVHRMQAGLDAEGKVVAWHFHSKALSRSDMNSNESNPSHTLVGMSLGHPIKWGAAFGVPSESYGFPNKRLEWEVIPAFLDRASPLRTAHLRDPIGPQVHFASECFMDEVALAAGLDPVEFRLRYLTDPRDIAVVKAAAEKAGWQPRVGPNPDRSGKVLTGRGIAVASRSGSTVATIAEVEVEPDTGRVWPRRFVVAHDCGLIINPLGLVKTIEGNIVQATSRALLEEVQFDEAMVTSVDWASYPILDIMDAPETIDVVLIDRKDVAPQGAGEPSTRQVAAAIGNAFFDATGVRLRRAPFTAERVKAALA